MIVEDWVNLRKQKLATLFQHLILLGILRNREETTKIIESSSKNLKKYGLKIFQNLLLSFFYCFFIYLFSKDQESPFYNRNCLMFQTWLKKKVVNWHKQLFLIKKLFLISKNYIKVFFIDIFNCSYALTLIKSKTYYIYSLLL